MAHSRAASELTVTCSTMLCVRACLHLSTHSTSTLVAQLAPDTHHAHAGSGRQHMISPASEDSAFALVEQERW